ncbi:Uncharacterised protein [Mycobacteroides abscessus subsp. abscessus]|nr:Uncharacterised protein [Mycobacteroides abscessus subsp. abscessus]
MGVVTATRQCGQQILTGHHLTGAHHQTLHQRHSRRRDLASFAINRDTAAAHADDMPAGVEPWRPPGQFIGNVSGQCTQPRPLGLRGGHTEYLQRSRGHRPNTQRRHPGPQRGQQLIQTAGRLGTPQHRGHRGRTGKTDPVQLGVDRHGDQAVHRPLVLRRLPTVHRHPDHLRASDGQRLA